jgi:hypothetical protein
LHRPWLLHLVIHPDGNIWTVDVVESSQSHSLGMPITMPHEKAAVVATEHCARLRRCAGSASPRQPVRVRRSQLLSPRLSIGVEYWLRLNVGAICRDPGRHLEGESPSWALGSRWHRVGSSSNASKPERTDFCLWPDRYRRRRHVRPVAAFRRGFTAGISELWQICRRKEGLSVSGCGHAGSAAR